MYNKAKPIWLRRTFSSFLLLSFFVRFAVWGFAIVAPTQRQRSLRAASDSTSIQDLKDSVDIVQVVETYGLAQFRRHSNGATAICPFHDDRNPSLQVNTERQIYKCFSCGASGDVFHFVQSYSELPGQTSFTSFGDVLRHVSLEFGDGQWKSYSKTTTGSNEVKDRKERILLANAAAQVFYADCLTQPWAGRARNYLKGRGIQSSTIRSFGLGCAPSSGLVGYLKSCNFTATEILDAGVAVVRNPKQSNRTNVTYSELTDKFRDRLIVPIVQGRKVLGFGGRELPHDTKSKKSTYKSPKYLNSPETLVFEKRKILFGSNQALKAFGRKNGPLLIVEGYLDAISLSNAGIENVVACMGTALSNEQLDGAARLSDRIVLCLDNDVAGWVAVERACSNGQIAQLTRKRTVDVSIAQLPVGLKDPAEFVELYDNSDEDIAQEFQCQVVDKAIDWTDWFIQHIVGGYSQAAPRGGRGSFGDIFERVANFLAVSMGPADRTKRAYEVSSILSTMIAKDRNETEVSNAVRMQLESDLIDLAARRCREKEAVQRRAEAMAANSTTVSAKQFASAIVSGGQLDSANGKMKALQGLQSIDEQNLPSGKYRPSQRKRRANLVRKKHQVESLTPHFAGFRFSHKSDRDWLGIQPQKYKVSVV